jgi:UV DNA damage endonuclease
LSLCRSTGLPLVYHVHHHRCLPDELSVEAATSQALDTWDREPLFHVSSPLGGWAEPMPRRHHDYIDVADFPDCWRNLAITVEVEAKAKELAVFRLRDELCADESRTGRRRGMVGTA